MERYKNQIATIVLNPHSSTLLVSTSFFSNSHMISQAYSITSYTSPCCSPQMLHEDIAQSEPRSASQEVYVTSSALVFVAIIPPPQQCGNPSNTSVMPGLPYYWSMPHFHKARQNWFLGQQILSVFQDKVNISFSPVQILGHIILGRKVFLFGFNFFFAVGRHLFSKI